MLTDRVHSLDRLALRNANRAKSITYGTLSDRAILPLLYIQIDLFVGVASVLRNRQSASDRTIQNLFEIS